MQTLVAVLLGHAEPVTQALGVGTEDIGDHRIDHPAVRFLPLRLGVEDDTDGKEVVDAIDVAMLGLHLMVDGVDRLGAALDGEPESGLFQLLLQRGDESGYVLLALGFLRVERVRDIFIGIVIQKLERQVFHLSLDLVETQFVRHRSMQRLGLTRHVTTAIGIARLIQLTEQI